MSGEPEINKDGVLTKIGTAVWQIGKGIYLAAHDVPQPIANAYNKTFGLVFQAMEGGTRQHMVKYEHKKGHMYTDPRWIQAFEALEKSIDESPVSDWKITIGDPRNLKYHMFLGESGPHDNLLVYDGFPFSVLNDVRKAYYQRSLIQTVDTNVDVGNYMMNRSQKQNSIEKNPNIMTGNENHGRNFQMQVIYAEDHLQDRLIQQKAGVGPKNPMLGSNIMELGIQMGNGYRPKVLKTEDFGWHANGFDRCAHNGVYGCDNAMFENQEQMDKFMGRFHVWKDTLLNKDILPSMDH
jgi:hypothetical protein